VFGPAVCIAAYDSLDEAIGIANDSPFCFQAAIHTQNIDAALRAARSLKARTVCVNEQTTFRTDWMPFGVDGHSGQGLGGIGYSMRDTRPASLTRSAPVQ
jgi:acyl-CoA reductase-like NAD-dependent aldehyde dehydrogenase